MSQISNQTKHLYVALYADLKGWDILSLDAAGLAEERATGRIVLCAADLGLTEAAIREAVDASSKFYAFNSRVAYMDSDQQAQSDALERAMNDAEGVVWAAVGHFLLVESVCNLKNLNHYM